MWRKRFEGVKISSSIPSKNSIQDRQSIIAQAAARGLQLSEDGKSWVPINLESSQLKNVENEPSNSGFVLVVIVYVILFFVISYFAFVIFIYIFFILPGTLLSGGDVSLFDFLFG